MGKVEFSRRSAITHAGARQSDPVAPLADPVGATRHLRGLLESELLDCFPLNLVETVSQAEIKAVAERAITVFMTAYGPVGQ